MKCTTDFHLIPADLQLDSEGNGTRVWAASVHGPSMAIQHYQCVHLLGHLARMPDEWLPKRALFGHMHINGSGVRGKRQKQWVHHVDYVREDLQLAGLSYTWWRKSQDRAGWRAAMKCVLQSA